MNLRLSTHRIGYALVLLWLSVGVPSFAREVRCPQDYLQKKIINDLVASKSVVAIDRLWKTVVAPDAVTQLMYAVRRTQLDPTAKSERLLIAAMPADSVVFDLIYSLCCPKYEDVSEAVAEIAAGSWIDLALQAVVRQGYGYSKILMLPYVGRHNADIGETIPCVLSELKDRAPRQYQSAFQGLPRTARERICLECC